MQALKQGAPSNFFSAVFDCCKTISIVNASVASFAFPGFEAYMNATLTTEFSHASDKISTRHSISHINVRGNARIHGLSLGEHVTPCYLNNLGSR